MKTNIFSKISLVFLVVFICILYGSCQSPEKRKRTRQEIKYRGPTDLKEMERLVAESKPPPETQSSKSKKKDSLETNPEVLTTRNFAQTEDSIPEMSCPVKKDMIKHATLNFWQDNLPVAYACAAQQLTVRKDDGLSQSMVYYLTQGKYAIYSKKVKSELPHQDPPPLTNWELLGPFPVSKLEVDGDPTFSDNPTIPALDAGKYILSLAANASFHSELVNGGVVTWKPVTAKRGTNVVDVHFPVHWNELGQGLSTSAVFEFQGWGRTNSYVKKPGYYTVQCFGVHTVYLRNDNATRVLVGDVYNSQLITAVVDLRVGPVGLVVPIRGSTQASFSCSIRMNPDGVALVAYPIMHIPHLLELSQPMSTSLAKFNGNKNVNPNGKESMGLLLSSVFSIALQNAQGHPLSVDLQLEQPKSLTTR